MTLPMRIIVIDDDREMRQSLDHLMSAAGWEVECLSRVEQLADRLPVFDPDVILSDVQMPGASGLDLLKEQDEALSPPIVLISAHGDIPMAVDAMQAGAYSFLEKPYDPRRLLNLLRNAARQRRLRLGADRLKLRLAELSGLDRALPGEHASIRSLREDITELRDTRAPILLLGETGVGRAAVARALHDLSSNPAAPFLVVNCAEPDALSKVIDDKSGLGAGVNGGALVLEDVGATQEHFQSPLLRAIEAETDQLRAGAFRLIATGDTGLEAAVRAGDFRLDLFYRLSAELLTIPPLRERGEDIALIYTQVLAEHAAVYETAAPEVTADDFAMLLAHEWPGNMRELRHIAERHVLAARRGRGSVSEALRMEDDLGDAPATLREAVAVFERRLIAGALKTHAGRMDDAANALGIGRRTLNEKIVKLGLDKSKVL